MYQFDGKLYKQRAGGVIGLRLTGVVAGIVTDRWYMRLVQELGENHVEL